MGSPPGLPGCARVGGSSGFTWSSDSGAWYPGRLLSSGNVDSVMLTTDTCRVKVMVVSPSCEYHRHASNVSIHSCREESNYVIC